MKKKFLFIGTILFVFFLTLLSSCKSIGEYVGLWIVGEDYFVDSTIRYTSIEELEKARASYGVQYYVDIYTSKKPISHLNSDVPYFHTIEYDENTIIHYQVVDIFFDNGEYYLEPNGFLLPVDQAFSSNKPISITRRIKNENGKDITITIKIYNLTKKES